jgi:uncharacterized protein (DUF58 family)
VRVRPTRQGIIVIVAAVGAFVIGRLFGLLELYVIGAALLLAALVAWLVVTIRRPRVEVSRWIRPSVLTAGDVGRVEVLVEQIGHTRSPAFELVEPVGTTRTARMAVMPLGPDADVSAGYRIPTERRGVLPIGPLTAYRQDVLGLARSTTVVADVEEVLVSPRAHLLDMPLLGQGILGRHLLALAQRLGPGDFHSLRDYVDGDEPRTIHWRASARSENLKVRQHSVEGLQRCVVLLDQHVPPGPDGEEAFERAVTAAASVVHSADRAGLTTRFVTGGVDLRGPDVAAHALRVLAPIQLGPPLGEFERDPGEGLGLVMVVTSSPAADAWRRTERIADPTLTRVGIFTAPGGSRGRLSVDASSLTGFREGWQRLAGGRVLSPDAPPIEVTS